ncbi:uncharacterized protein LOC133335625 [Musca vetustissima]|uniref:uncharacterized protein LOC133335625 n=1 Tax=Musca vetustissima TaxID=27455 RepID=UPI002AB68AAF|nr:uncharacterized protein LOC133335625 [Musca vetustissima]
MADSGREEYLIQDFLHNKDVAPWFRGTSIFHLRGANQLFNAIRDDAEQRTSHRVKTCLNLIGLEPIPSSRDLKFIMHLSRGNDLAFLWFLMEMQYKGSDRPTNAYSLNEQLICSAICHLDMATTLRELDKILPKGRTCTSKENTKSKHQGRKENCRFECKSNHKYFSKPQKCCKHLGMEEENHQREAKSANKYILPYFEKLSRPQHYGNPLNMYMPNFKVQFRTYASYADPNQTVYNESNRWFADYDINPGRRVAYQAIKNAIAQLFEDFKKANPNEGNADVLCAYHKTIKEIEQLHKHEYMVKLRDKCLKNYFGNKLDLTQKRSNLMKLSLYRAIEAEMSMIQKQTTSGRNPDFLKTITSEGKMLDVDVGGEYGTCCTESIVATTQLENEISTSPDSTLTAKFVQNYDFGNVGDTPETSQTYFHGPTKHAPIIFEYKKIFQNVTKIPEGDWVKLGFLDALDQDISRINDVREAAQQCASDIWQRELQKFTSEHNDSKMLSSSPLPQYPPNGKYDAGDRILMDKMLADAFEYMRKNPKFVLVQLHEAHKLPMLREWIARRYGKVYTPKDRYESFRYSLNVFHALDRMSFDFPTPTSTQIGRHHFVAYNCKKYLGMKVDEIKRQFFRRLDNAIMKQSRTYWFAMRGYLCSGPGPPRQTFFAYMPSRLRDIQRFRLWKISEHRSDKAAWDKLRVYVMHVELRNRPQ